MIVVGKTINSPLLTHKIASSLSLIRMIAPFFSDAYSCPNSKLTRKPAWKSCSQNIPKFAPRNEFSRLIRARNCVNVARKWNLRNLADPGCDMLRGCAIFHHLRFLQTTHLLFLMVLLLVLSVLILFAPMEHAKLEPIECCTTIPTSFDELEAIHMPF